MDQLSKALATLSKEQVLGIRRGLEKESLRALPGGGVALTPHPAGLGSALTHTRITTDFSESQLELITGVHATVNDCLAELTDIQRFTTSKLGDEMLWVSSMPCGLPADDAIPIGQYGTSNVGRAKSVYRTGLGHRYGRRMQTISGIHYNWSFPGLSSEAYFGLIRNFRRNAFLLLYLFGASPAVCSSFVAGRQHALQRLSEHTMYLPYATSLRMGRLGYQSDAQSSLAVSYNSLEGYAHSLEGALTSPYPAYEAIGVRGEDGQYRQLGTSLLQIENEFYGTMRPKRVIFPGERPLHALRERGVEYVEVRLMDLDPFEPMGISEQTMCFLDVFLTYCHLAESPDDTLEEIAALGHNQHIVAERGREPGLTLTRGTEQVLLTDWGRELLTALGPIAAKMDGALGGTQYAHAVDAAMRLLDNPKDLPSARVLREVQEHFDGSFVGFVRAQSVRTKQTMLGTPLAEDRLAHFEGLTAHSVKDQAHIEANDSMPFDIYLQEYLSPRRLVAKAA